MAGEDHTARSADQTGDERRRYTVAEAAELLGITAEAVRTRIKRRKLDSEKIDGTVYVLLSVDQTRPNFDPTAQGQDQTSDQTRRDELIENLREQVAYLQGVIATRDQELGRRDEEIRRRDAALERELQLTAMFAERLRALEAPAQKGEARETHQDARQAAETPPEGEGTRPTNESFGALGFTQTTVRLFTYGTGVAAGAANPLLIGGADNPVWLALLALWALPPIFGLWLGRAVEYLMAVMEFRVSEAARKGPPPRQVWQKVWRLGGEEVYSQDYIEDLATRLGLLRSRPTIFALRVGAVATFGSLVASWFGAVSPPVPLRIVLGVAIAQGIVAAMFVLFAALLGLGRARQRREAERPTAGDETSAEASAARRQALIGLLGTIITAIASIVVVVIQQVVGGSGG